SDFGWVGCRETGCSVCGDRAIGIAVGHCLAAWIRENSGSSGPHGDIDWGGRHAITSDHYRDLRNTIGSRRNDGEDVPWNLRIDLIAAHEREWRGNVVERHTDAG